MESNNDQLIAVSTGEGQGLSVVGDTYRILVSGKQTAGAFAVIDLLIPPGGGPGPHAHANFQESFYVVDGEIEVKSKGNSYVAKKGAFVSIPSGGMVHCFKNKTDKIAHLVCTVVPAGLDAMFEEMGEPVAADAFLPAPAMDAGLVNKMTALAKKYDQQLFPPDYLD